MFGNAIPLLLLLLESAENLVLSTMAQVYLVPALSLSISMPNPYDETCYEYQIPILPLA